MKYRNKAYLIEQYKNQDKTIVQIAKDLHVCKATIWKYFNRFGIEMNKVRPRKNINHIKCAYCRKPIIRYSCQLGERNFCNYQCYYSWMSENRSGENSFSWKGGITAISSKGLKTPEFRKLKQIILRRFPLCVICGNTNYPHVHHIKTRREYPELIFDEKNLITLCRSCHSKIKGKEKEWEEYFSGLVCKSGELRGSLSAKAYGNPQPSQPKVIDLIGWKVQRLMGEDTLTNTPDTSAAHESEEIVRACPKG